uniref:Putative streptococcal hemagglutinin-like protein n=1 Tax=Leishmania guyanensis TaxID=5670 RepID=A0A1E1J9J2_LEIGU|nr:Putative streptococcal hemagglutinin-like protein [Leishmania guyanensis]
MYVQRKAFAEIAEGQDRCRSPTVTLERLVKVLGWFELALNPSAVERVCGIPMQSAGEPRDISIDFNAFVKIMDSSLDCQHHSEGSRPSSEWASAPVTNNEDPQFNAIVLALPPEAPARAFPAVPLIPGLTAAGAESLSSGSGPAPCTQAAPYTSSVCDSGDSIRSLWSVAFATSAAHRRSGSLSSVATTTASSAVSGASVPKSSVDTDDAYPLATHGSAAAAASASGCAKSCDGA